MFVRTASLALLVLASGATLRPYKAPGWEPHITCKPGYQLLKQAKAAMTADDSERELTSAQQAVEAFEMCDNLNWDDKASEVEAEMMIAANFQDSGNVQRSRDMFSGASMLLIELCENNDPNSHWRNMSVMGSYLLYRNFGVRQDGLTDIDDCRTLYGLH